MKIRKNIRGISYVLSLFFLCGQLAYAKTDADQQLVERITQSKQQLVKAEEKIARERSAFARQVAEKEDKVSELMKQAEVLARISDEKLLSLEQLETRVEEWERQSNYQAHLIRSYIESVDSAGNIFDHDEEKDGLVFASLEQAITRTESMLYPQWQKHDFVNDNGKVLDGEILTLGPVSFVFSEVDNQGGLLLNELGEEKQLSEVYTDQQKNELNQIRKNGVGLVTFDPTLGRAYELLKQSDGLVSHMEKGGIWALPIIFFGCLSFVISVLKGIQLYRLPRVDTQLKEKLVAQIDSASNSKSPQEFKQSMIAWCKNTSGPQAKLVSIAMSLPVSEQREDMLIAFLMEYKHRIEKYMGVVATSAAVAPLLGLLGTVSGMIETFKMMNIFGASDASTVSGGISEALITTELGLVVAIPSLILSALLSRQARSYVHALDATAVKISKVEFPLLTQKVVNA